MRTDAAGSRGEGGGTTCPPPALTSQWQPGLMTPVLAAHNHPKCEGSEKVLSDSAGQRWRCLTTEFVLKPNTGNPTKLKAGRGLTAVTGKIPKQKPDGGLWIRPKLYMTQSYPNSTTLGTVPQCDAVIRRVATIKTIPQPIRSKAQLSIKTCYQLFIPSITD